MRIIDRRRTMNVVLYFESLTAELESLKNRVRNFIRQAHWLTDGEWKESVLRSILSKKLPETVRVGRGFVLTLQGPSSQCDILLYKASSPILFREGDLVFLTPDAVLGIIEVKSRTDRRVLERVIDKFSKIGRKLGSHRVHCFFGLFSYENAISRDCQILESLREKCDHETKIIDLVSIGCSTFVKWWKYSPAGGTQHYEKWHSYHLENMAAGYFIANVIDFVSPDSVGSNDWFWFPEEGKESKKTGEISVGHALNQ
jgi:hypothetical protein